MKSEDKVLDKIDWDLNILTSWNPATGIFWYILEWEKWVLTFELL